MGLSCLAGLAAIACQRESRRELRDTEGRTFSAQCNRQGECQLTQKSGLKRADLPTQALLTGGRLIGICDVEQARDPEGAFDCRPLRCDSDAECPPAHGARDGQCINHWCTDPAGQIGPQDSVLLCLAGTGLGRESPRQIERYALALNCGAPCKVPAPCAQP